MIPSPQPVLDKAEAFTSLHSWATSPATQGDLSLSISPLKPPAKEQPDGDQPLQELSNVTVLNESTSCCSKRFSQPQSPTRDHLELEGLLRHPSGGALYDTDT